MPPPCVALPGVFVETKKGDASLRQTLWETCAGIHPEWRTVNIDEMKVDQISGGITNLLYKVSGPAVPLLVRVYGDNTDVIIDRAKETNMLKQLSDVEFAVPFYGTFGNGRVEGYKELRPLKPEELGCRSPVDFQDLIAGQMAAMHSLKIDEPENSACLPQLFAMTEMWAKSAMEIASKPQDRQALYSRIDVPKMYQELQWLSTILPSSRNKYGEDIIHHSHLEGVAAAATRFAFASVFCHNDVLCGNILVDREAVTSCQLIDFEYGSYNNRAFDIANHFDEYSGFDGDWGKWHPTDDQMLHFLKAYMRHSKDGSDVFETLSESSKDEFLLVLLKWTSIFCMASHLWWGFWCIIQAHNSPIDFDFLDYGRIRFVGYFYHKGLYAHHLFSH